MQTKVFDTILIDLIALTKNCQFSYNYNQFFNIYYISIVNNILELLNDYILLSMDLFIKLLEILSSKKKYWLYPIMFFFTLFAILTYFFQGSSVPPWIYSIF